MRHLYVHIPFCRSRCAYCDFASEPVGPHLRAGRVERYLEVLRKELAAHTAAEAGDGVVAGGANTGAVLRAGSVETIYVGGGTPTVLPGAALLTLASELSTLKSEACGEAEAELTVEANPGTIDVPLLQHLRKAGVTRLSLGVQSFAPALRAALGRRVSQREIESALRAVAEAGWGEWNLDLIFGIPGQTWADAAADVDAAVAAGPTHVSLYDLTYTPAFRARVDGIFAAEACGAAAGGSPAVSGAHGATGTRAAAATHETAAAFAEQHYADAAKRLEAAGYRRYEVSNFAVPGHECRHNQAYWRGEDYLGVGAAAVSTAGGERRTNPRSVKHYLAGCPPQIEALSPATRLWEKAMLGLRTTEGVDERAVLPVLDVGARDRFLAQGFLERHYGKLRLNPGFLDISNTVISTLLVSPEES